MTEPQHSQPRPAATSAGDLSRDDLLDILQRYNEVTERLQQSHDRMQHEVGRLRGELEQKNRELERRQRLAMLGEMAAGVAHEIRNPLGGIALCADMLADDLAERSGPSAIVERVQGGVRILNRIVEDMLLFARDLHVDPAPVALVEPVQAALGLAEHDIRRGGLRVVVAESTLEAEVHADGSLLARAVLNLVLNAAQAAEGRREASLRIAAEPADRGRAIALVVEDTCGGIGEADLPKVFNPFFTRREQGTGLGLAIVHRTVEAHGGRIDVRNNTVGGTTFTLVLPAAHEAETAQAGRPTQPADAEEQ